MLRSINPRNFYYDEVTEAACKRELSMGTCEVVGIFDRFWEIRLQKSNRDACFRVLGGS